MIKRCFLLMFAPRSSTAARGDHSKLLTELYNRPSTYPSKNIWSFQWWFRHKYTLCEIFSGITKTGHWVSCIRILEYRGSKLEAQMTLGHVYSVHHNTFTYITEIKRALHNRVLLPHFFFFPRLLRRLWAQAKPSTTCASAKDIWAIESHNSLKSIQ